MTLPPGDGTRGAVTDETKDPGEDLADNPPDGFEQGTRGPFTTHNGPFYFKVTPDGVFHGFRARRRHCNGHGIVHGGLLMTFADGLLAAAVWKETRTRMVTMRMTSDFLAMARPGEWVEGLGQVTMADDGVAFGEARIYVGERTVMTAQALFKLMPAKDG